jgi:hypothetical protein
MSGHDEPSDEEFATFRAQLAQLYNESIKLLDGTLEPVLRLIEQGDVVAAVWPDPSAPQGIDFLRLKGTRLLREILAGGNPLGRGFRATVVPCQSYEHAIATKEWIGERDLDA